MATIKLNEQTLAAIRPPSDEAQAYYWDTEVTGFGVVVGRSGIKTFVARARVDGKKVKTTIGIAGRVREDGHEWTVKLARVRAREILGQMAGGTNPNSGKNERRDAPTLREGLALHVGEMKDAGKRPRSIETIEYDMPRLMSAWLDRPLSDLTVETVQRIKEKNRKHKTRRIDSSRTSRRSGTPRGASVAARSPVTTRSGGSASRSTASIRNSRALKKRTCPSGCGAWSCSRIPSAATFN